MVNFREAQPAFADRSSESLCGESTELACMPAILASLASLILCSSASLTLENEIFFFTFGFPMFLDNMAIFNK